MIENMDIKCVFILIVVFVAVFCTLDYLDQKECPECHCNEDPKYNYCHRCGTSLKGVLSNGDKLRSK